MLRKLPQQAFDDLQGILKNTLMPKDFAKFSEDDIHKLGITLLRVSAECMKVYHRLHQEKSMLH